MSTIDSENISKSPRQLPDAATAWDDPSRWRQQTHRNSRD